MLGTSLFTVFLVLVSVSVSLHAFSMIGLTLFCFCISHQLKVYQFQLHWNVVVFYHRMHLRYILYLPGIRNKSLREVLQYIIRSLMDGLIIGLIFKCAKLDSFQFTYHPQKLRDFFFYIKSIVANVV